MEGGSALRRLSCLPSWACCEAEREGRRKSRLKFLSSLLLMYALRRRRRQEVGGEAWEVAEGRKPPLLLISSAAPASHLRATINLPCLGRKELCLHCMLCMGRRGKWAERGVLSVPPTASGEGERRRYMPATILWRLSGGMWLLLPLLCIATLPLCPLTYFWPCLHGDASVFLCGGGLLEERGSCSAVGCCARLYILSI